MRTKVKKVCEICGKEFEAFSDVSKYCSQDCRKIVAKQQQEKTFEKKCREWIRTHNTFNNGGIQPSKIILQDSKLDSRNIANVIDMAKKIGNVRLEIIIE